MCIWRGLYNIIVTHSKCKLFYPSKILGENYLFQKVLIKILGNVIQCKVPMALHFPKLLPKKERGTAEKN